MNEDDNFEFKEREIVGQSTTLLAYLYGSLVFYINDVFINIVTRSAFVFIDGH